MECTIYQKVKKAGMTSKEVKKIVFFILRYLKKQKGQVSVHLVGEQMIKKINFLYRGTNRTTDVIAFAIQEGKWKGDKNDLGDIFLCISQIRRQTKAFKVGYKEELVRMITHGILHLLGYEHKTQKDERKMFALQEKIVNRYL